MAIRNEKIAANSARPSKTSAHALPPFSTPDVHTVPTPVEARTVERPRKGVRNARGKIDNSGRKINSAGSKPSSSQNLTALTVPLNSLEFPARKKSGLGGSAARGYGVNALILSQTLRQEMDNHGDNPKTLAKRLLQSFTNVQVETIAGWLNGQIPNRNSFKTLRAIACLYGLPSDHFVKAVPRNTHFDFIGIEEFPQVCRSLIAYHLPSDFNDLNRNERRKIFAWIRRNVLTGSTDYRHYLREMCGHRYRLRFDQPPRTALDYQVAAFIKSKTTDRATGSLVEENEAWTGAYVESILLRFGTFFGFLSASPQSHSKGLGITDDKLCIWLLVFTNFIDLFLRWIIERRGFYTSSEATFVTNLRGLTADNSGWLRANPPSEIDLTAISDLLSQEEIDWAINNWQLNCDTAQQHFIRLSKIISKNKSVHRVSFDAISPVLNSKDPYVEYYKIADEILLRRPKPEIDPIGAAKSARSYLIIRLGLCLGLRQKNLRELLICVPGAAPRRLSVLNKLKRGEIRWVEDRQQWEVIIPYTAFKNSRSSFFGRQPWRYYIENIDYIHEHIHDYVETYRQILMDGAPDPGTFFVKTTTRSHKDPSYNRGQFYAAWLWITQMYGVYNPYTGRGAIKGLIPHGPHNVRDVLATQILRETHDARRAGYAIQDTPQSVERYYVRMLPTEKAAEAARILNAAWARHRSQGKR